MKKFLCWLLVLTLCGLVPAALGEEEDGHGTVEVLQIDAESDEPFTAAPSLPTETESLDAADIEANQSISTESGLNIVLSDDDVSYSIFGKDNRATIKNTRKYPYSAIAHMVIKGECGCTWDGTGFMVSSHALVTAAQNLVCSDHSTWAENINFYFGFSNLQNYMYSYTGTWTAYVGTTFPDHRYSADYDYGFVRFYKEVGNQTGWFGMSFMGDKEISNTLLHVAGYQQYKLKHDSGFAEAVNSRLIQYKMDTTYGCAGGPVYTSDGYAVGIDIATNSSGNYGYRLTYALYQKMCELGIY